MVKGLRRTFNPFGNFVFNFVSDLVLTLAPLVQEDKFETKFRKKFKAESKPANLFPQRFQIVIGERHFLDRLNILRGLDRLA